MSNMTTKKQEYNLIGRIWSFPQAYAFEIGYNAEQDVLFWTFKKVFFLKQCMSASLRVDL